MKTDNYLTLCLEQAAKSPLHYRHGCIVVRGGKVIGQGYNDYRPGFNGGALKTGRLASASCDGPALLELKEKIKEKNKPKTEEGHQKQQAAVLLGSTATFTPFESFEGGGHLANTPLSMHSEMMAIHSALATSSKLGSTAWSCQKPSFKLPGDSKRKQRLRKQGLEEFKSVVLKHVHLNQVNQYQGNDNNNEYEYEYKTNDNKDKALATYKRRHVAFHPSTSGVKQHVHWKKKAPKKEKKKTNHGQDQPHDRSGQQTQQGQQRPLHALKDIERTLQSTHRPPGHNKTVEKDSSSKEKSSSQPVPRMGTNSTDRDGPINNTKRDKPIPPHHILVPAGRAGHMSWNVQDRTKDPRLIGADLYVTRLGWTGSKGDRKSDDREPGFCTHIATRPAGLDRSPEDSDISTSCSDTDEASYPDSLASSCSSAATSLHDELRNPHPKPRPVTTTVEPSFERKAIHASRPCYRCVAYMHSVGIRRVFWTNDDGNWEGGKVRDLVDALGGSMEDGNAGLGGPTGNGVFITKHEVLMLRRRMGQNK